MLEADVLIDDDQLSQSNDENKKTDIPKNSKEIIIDDTLEINKEKFKMKNKISIKEGLAKKSKNDKIESWNDDC